MLRALRRNSFASLFALLVIAGSIPLSVAALLHAATDDEICQPAFVVHDESAHRFEAARRTAAPESQHCYICHFLQSLRTVETTVVVAGPSTSSQQLMSTAAVAVGVSTLGHLPARAPPVS